MQEYLEMINKLSGYLSIPMQKLLHKAEYPVQLYRYLTFARMSKKGFTHQAIAGVSGFSRETVTYGIRIANTTSDCDVVSEFNKAINE